MSVKLLDWLSNCVVSVRAAVSDIEKVDDLCYLGSYNRSGSGLARTRPSGLRASAEVATEPS